MATLREYFDTDFQAVMNAASTLSLTINAADASVGHEVPARVHYDFDSGTKYVSYFVSSGPQSAALCEGLLMNPQWTFDAVKGVLVTTGIRERQISASDLKFSGRIFIYTEDLLPVDQAKKILEMAKQRGFDVVMRTPVSAIERSRQEAPCIHLSRLAR